MTHKQQQTDLDNEDSIVCHKRRDFALARIEISTVGAKNPYPHEIRPMDHPNIDSLEL